MKRNKFSNWREDLIEVVDVPSSEPKTDKKSERKIDTKEVKNKIVINPQMTEAFEEIGGVILEVTEVDEAYYGGEEQKKKDEKKAAYEKQLKKMLPKRAFDQLGREIDPRSGKLKEEKLEEKLSKEDLEKMQDEKDKKEGRKPGKVEEKLEALMMRRAKKEADIAKTDMKIAKERKKSAQAPDQVQERALSSDEKEEKERIVKGMKKSKGGFEKRYGDDAKSVMYATATKLAKEETEDSLRDRRMERGGVDGNNRYDRAPKAPNTKKFGTGKTMAQKEMEKRYGKGATAMDIVRAKIQAKHGKGAIMDTKKKAD